MRSTGRNTVNDTWAATYFDPADDGESGEHDLGWEPKLAKMKAVCGEHWTKKRKSLMA
jgi:hypothetical protein